MRPKFRAWGVERDPGLKQPAPKMHRNVSVVTTYTEGITFVLTDFNMWGDDEYSGSIIDDAILMQSTGLFDRNGKEVFVGDIVKCTRGCLHEVYIEKEYGGTYIGGMPAIYLKDLREGYAWTEHEEILGNIYENPELLEEKE